MLAKGANAMKPKVDFENGQEIRNLYSKLSTDFPEEKRIYTSRLVCFLLIQQQLGGKSAQRIVSECVNFEMYKEF